MRSYQFENTRAIVYAIAAVNRDPKKPFPTMQEFWSLITDIKSEKIGESTLREERNTMVERLNRLYGKNLKA